jgi:polysaccharide deacetylase 2 family uncharacterized protein YibQ
VADDLSAPLGQDTKRRRRNLSAVVPTAIAVALGLFIAVFLVWAAVVSDPMGGEPKAVVAVDMGAAAKDTPAKPEAKNAPAAADQPSAAAKDVPSGMQSVTIIDGSSGSRQEVLVPGRDDPSAEGGDAKLLERTRHGLVPRVSLDGARPSVAYARPLPAGDAGANMPRIALVVSGLGISASNTAEAMGKMPGPVTFAFAPYGTDLGRLVARARGEGHEVLLQLPMEPFDYPDNDPGPQTLLTSLAPEQNIDRVHWLMSRFQGYVGVVNYMGARFTASESAFAPVLREVAQRGLLYLDDGASPRSLASQIAGANNLPFAKANVVLDAVPSAAEVDRALQRLESMARDNGAAVGIAGALPVTLARIGQWVKSAPSRGFLLVPISAAASKPKSS